MKKIVCSLLATLLNTAVCAEGDILDLIVPVIASSASNNTSTWGAKRISPSTRPERTWLNGFNGVTPIEVPSGVPTIAAALNSCGSAYCVIRIDQLHLSDTVFLDRSKTKLVGATGNRITYVDTVGDSGAFIEIGDNVEQVAIDGLNLDGQSRAYGDNTVFGMMVYGQNIDKIAFKNNEIHHLNSDVDAHGIAVYGLGNSDSNAVKNVIISGNEVHHMRTGSSESIAVNGNVKHWEIKGNTVRQINNIAIDAIGGEATSPVRVVNGRTLPGLFDAARFGFIENNRVIDMTTLDNPAYGREHSWAGGIYVDGARDLIIANNTVTRSEWAYDIGAENCVRPSNIVFENNTANASYYGDFLMGGYAVGGFAENAGIECNPLISIDDNEGHGYVERVTVKNNQFNTLTPVEDQGRINLLFRIRQSVIIQSGVSAEHPNGVVSGDQNSIRTTQ